MTEIMIFIKALPTIWKFWGELKVIFKKLGEMKEEWEARQFVKDLNKASSQTDDSGDTSGYEDIIRRGKK